MVIKVQDTENLHFKVLRQLQAKPEMSQRELAQALGVSMGKTNYCLKALLDQDLVRKHKFQGKRRRLSYAYLLTPNGTAEKANRFTHESFIFLIQR